MLPQFLIKGAQGLAARIASPNSDVLPGVTISNRPGQRDVNPFNNPKPTTRSSGGGGGGGGWGDTAGMATTTQMTASDPYAQWGGQSAYNNLLSGFNTQKQGILDSVGRSITGSRRGMEGGIDKFLEDYLIQNRNLNEAGINSEMAKYQGRTGVLDMVGRGMKSAGQMLGNRNAGSSSATQAFADLYRDMGGREMNKVSNQYEESQRQTQQGREDLSRQASLFERNLQRQKETAIDEIVSDAQNKLAALDAAMAEASLPERIAIEQEKNNIRNQAREGLANLDRMLATGMGKQKALTRDQAIAEAQRRATAGYAPTESYDFDTTLPGELQGETDVNNLPIYTRPLYDQEEV